MDKKIHVIANRGCVTKVPTELLIEDWQGLIATARDGDMDAVSTVAACIAQVIEDYTEVPVSSSLKFRPSASSMILPSNERGVLSTDAGEDIRCAAGMEMSSVIAHGCLQCPEGCAECRECDPENGIFELENGCLYACVPVRDQGKAGMEIIGTEERSDFPDCESCSCVYNHDGECRYAAVHEKLPEKREVCQNFVAKPGYGPDAF